MISQFWLDRAANVPLSAAWQAKDAMLDPRHQAEDELDLLEYGWRDYQ